MRPIAATLIVLGACALGCGSDASAGDSASTASSSGGSATTSSAGSGGSATSDASSSASTSAGGSNGPSGTGGATGTTADSSGGGAGEATTGVDVGSGGSAGGIEPYANVVAVETSGSDGSYTFNVSIESSDVGCTQYADWWEVLSETGELLYRRILTHSHTNENGTTDDTSTPDNTFTRSGGPVAIAADEMVIVRAHNSVAGYNGVVMQGSPGAGFSEAPDITSDFAADVEDDDPQVESCEF